MLSVFLLLFLCAIVFMLFFMLFLIRGHFSSVLALLLLELLGLSVIVCWATVDVT